MGPDPKPTRLSKAVERTRAAANPQPVSQSPVRVALEGEADLSALVARLLLPFLMRDDGWLRVSPKEDGATVYWKWKWTGGKHVNHYVMTVYPAAESAEALRRLAIKVDACDRGVEAPVKDHYFQ